MIVFVTKYLLPKNIRGITIFPFVFLKHKEDAANKTLLNHEKIHLKQQVELLILPFYIWYFVEFLAKLAIYKNKNKAYKNISFEREAYRFDNNLDYLNTRKRFEFIKYL